MRHYHQPMGNLVLQYPILHGWVTKEIRGVLHVSFMVFIIWWHQYDKIIRPPSMILSLYSIFVPINNCKLPKTTSYTPASSPWAPPAAYSAYSSPWSSPISEIHFCKMINCIIPNIHPSKHRNLYKNPTNKCIHTEWGLNSTKLNQHQYKNQNRTIFHILQWLPTSTHKMPKTYTSNNICTYIKNWYALISTIEILTIELERYRRSVHRSPPAPRWLTNPSLKLNPNFPQISF